MSLEVNQNDKSANVTYIPNPKKEFRRKIAGALITIMLFSGSFIGMTEAKAQEASLTATQSISSQSEDPNQIIEIPEIYKYDVAYACGKEEDEPITIEDLSNIQTDFLVLGIYDDSSLEWLNYCKGIQELVLAIHTDNVEMFKDIDQLNVPRLSITTDKSLSLTKENFGFLSRSKPIKQLSLYDLDIEPGILENLAQLEELLLESDENYEIDFSKLTFLDKLTFALANPYDIAIDFTNQEYQSLINDGVEVVFDSPDKLAQFIEINKKLDEIVESLNLNENSSDQEKLDAILIYVLDNLTYDEDVSNALTNNIAHEGLTSSFYEGGYLYGALEKQSAICGNYTALVQALSERVGLSSYFLTSSDHAWNLITVEGQDYYVDSTWLDGNVTYTEKTKEGIDENGSKHISISYSPVTAQDSIREGKTEELDWYMEDPTNYPIDSDKKESHEVINLPSFIKLTPINKSTDTTKETEKPENITKDSFEVSIGNKKWIIGGGAAIGILAAIGGAVAIGLKKKKQAERRRQQSQNYNSADTSTSYNRDYYSSEPFGSNSFGDPFKTSDPFGSNSFGDPFKKSDPFGADSFGDPFGTDTFGNGSSNKRRR